MKFYIVDNGSIYLYEMVAKIEAAGHFVHVQKYSPYEELDPLDADLIILSGGNDNEVTDQLEDDQPWFRHEFELIRSSVLPILGICLGHQMIATALGGTLLKLPGPVAEVVNVRLNETGQLKLGYNNIYALENHQYIVDEFNETSLIELARSKDGVEMLYEPDRKILGVQFHPEIFVNKDSESIFWDLIALIHSPVGSHKVA